MLTTLILFIGSTRTVDAAQFYLAPVSTAIYQGSTFYVYLKVNSADQASNSYSASIVFDSNYVEPVSVMKSGSICSLFIVEPTLAPGSASVTCGLPTPGFQGNSGTVAILNLRAKKVGTTYLGISNGAILANDGKGTNILNASTGINIRILDSGGLPPEREPEVTIPAPQIKSDRGVSGEWMKDREINFTWNKPENSKSFSYILTKDPNEKPPLKSMTEGTTVGFKDLADGTYYFRIMALNGNSKSPVAEYIVRIDNTGPETLDVIIEPSNEDIIKTVPLFGFIGVDNGSGLSKYQFSLDDGEFYDVKNPYILTNVSGGEHIATIRAIDALGNYTDKAIPFKIIEIKAPIINSPTNGALYNEADGVEIKGKATPNSSILVYLNGKLYSTVLSDKDGNFSFNFNRALKAGKYNISIQERTEGGILGELSSLIDITIESSFIPVSSFSILKDENTMIMIGGSCLLMLVVLTLFLIILIKKKRKKRKYEQLVTATPNNDIPDEGTTAIQGGLVGTGVSNEDSGEPINGPENNSVTPILVSSDIATEAMVEGQVLTSNKTRSEVTELTPEAKYELQKRLSDARVEIDQEIHDLERELRKKVEDDPNNTLEEEHQMEAAITEAVDLLEDKIDEMLDPEKIIEGKVAEELGETGLNTEEVKPILENPLENNIDPEILTQKSNVLEEKPKYDAAYFAAMSKTKERSREEQLEGALNNTANAISVDDATTKEDRDPVIEELSLSGDLDVQEVSMDKENPYESVEPIQEQSISSLYSPHIDKPEMPQDTQLTDNPELSENSQVANTSSITETPPTNISQLPDDPELTNTEDNNYPITDPDQHIRLPQDPLLSQNPGDTTATGPESEEALADRLFEGVIKDKEPVDHSSYSNIYRDDDDSFTGPSDTTQPTDGSNSQ